VPAPCLAPDDAGVYLYLPGGRVPDAPLICGRKRTPPRYRATDALGECSLSDSESCRCGRFEIDRNLADRLHRIGVEYAPTAWLFRASAANRKIVRSVFAHMMETTATRSTGGVVASTSSRPLNPPNHNGRGCPCFSRAKRTARARRVLDGAGDDSRRRGLASSADRTRHFASCHRM